MSATCEQFVTSVGEALDYARHMRLWSHVFPDFVVRTYEETANAAARFFLGTVLKIGDLDRFAGLDLRINTSLARDLVELLARAERGHVIRGLAQGQFRLRRA